MADRTLSSALKRTVDVVVSCATIAVLAPLLVAIAIAIVADSRGGVLFRSVRIGRGRHPFAMLKFRTMVSDPDFGGPPVTARNDLRVTRVGRVLRRTKLDELPNLVNVLRGEMSLVGPRPETPELVDAFDPLRCRVCSVLPGMTGLVQLRFPNEEAMLAETDLRSPAYAAHVRQKLELDGLYVERASLLRDLAILLCTALAMVSVAVDLTSLFGPEKSAKSASPTPSSSNT